jgi:hypothetical protein
MYPRTLLKLGHQKHPRAELRRAEGRFIDVARSDNGREEPVGVPANDSRPQKRSACSTGAISLLPSRCAIPCFSSQRSSHLTHGFSLTASIAQRISIALLTVLPRPLLRGNLFRECDCD